MKKKLPSLLLFLCLAGAARAAAPPATGSSEPVTISAAKSLEWDRKKKTYTARQNVIVKQGAGEIHSDTLVARYAEADGMSDIRTLEADGNVTITSAPYTAHGDHATYDVRSGKAVLTGKALRIETGDDTLTARDRIEFSNSENKMTAVGDALVLHDEKTLSADTMSAYFTKDKDGKTTARKITADGNVTIKTAAETATGDKGIYDVGAQKAVLTGKVRLLQGQNWLEGTRADVDMKTGISRLSGSDNPATEGRVTGVFYPQTKKETTPAGAAPNAGGTAKSEAPSK